MDKLSYGIGILVAQNLKKQGLTQVSTNDLAQGIQDVIQDADLKISLQEANEALQSHLSKQAAEKYQKNLLAGRKFLEENGKRPEVITLPSGLQYEVLTEGSGSMPKITDRVTTHYHGTLIDGAVFDSSVQRGTPATFPVNGVIRGWVEALQLMKTGSKWKLFVPYDLAYGEQGAGEMITPYTTLIFEVELLKIN